MDFNQSGWNFMQHGVALSLPSRDFAEALKVR